MGANLIMNLCQALTNLPIFSIIVWMDSMVALYWITNPGAKLGKPSSLIEYERYRRSQKRTLLSRDTVQVKRMLLISGVEELL